MFLGKFQISVLSYFYRTQVRSLPCLVSQSLMLLLNFVRIIGFFLLRLTAITKSKKFIEGMWRRSGYHFLFSSMFFLSPWDKSNLTTSPIVSTATIHNPSRECANSEIHSIKVLRENHHPSGTFPLKVTLTSAKLFSNFYKEGILSSVQFRSTFLIKVKIFHFEFKILLEMEGAQRYILFTVFTQLKLFALLTMLAMLSLLTLLSPLTLLRLLRRLSMLTLLPPLTLFTLLS